MSTFSLTEKIAGVSYVPNPRPAPSKALELRQEPWRRQSSEEIQALLRSILKGPGSAEWSGLGRKYDSEEAVADLNMLDMIWDAFAEPEICRNFSLRTVANICAMACANIRAFAAQQAAGAPRGNFVEATVRCATLRSRATGLLLRWEWFLQKRTSDGLWSDLIEDFAIELEYLSLGKEDHVLRPGSVAYELIRSALLQSMSPQGLTSTRLVLVDFEIRHLAFLAEMYCRVTPGSEGVVVDLRDGVIAPLSASASRKWLETDSRHLRYFDIKQCKWALDALPSSAFLSGGRSDVLRFIKQVLLAFGHNHRSSANVRAPALIAANLTVGLRNVRTALISKITLESVEEPTGALSQIKNTSIVNISDSGCRVVLSFVGQRQAVFIASQLVWIKAASAGIDRVATIAWIERKDNDDGAIVLGIRFLAGQPVVLAGSSPKPWLSQLRVEQFVALVDTKESDKCRLITSPDEFLENREVLIPVINPTAQTGCIVARGADYDLVEIQCAHG